MNAMTLLILLLLLSAGGLLVAGVYLLVGLAWAMIAAAVVIAAFAGALTRSLTPDV